MNLEISDREALIEDAGLMFDEWGLGRTPGRIIGYLMIADPPYKSMNDITEQLSMAKSTISIGLRLLTNYGFIEKFSVPGERADYYRLDHSFFPKGVAVKVQAMKSFRDLIGKAMEIVGEENDHRNEALLEMYEMYDWLEAKFPQLFEEWENEWKRRQAQRKENSN